MTSRQILTKVIQKAIDGGWKHPNGWTYLANYRKKAPFNSVQFADETGEVWHMPIETLIFNHDFAEALWGEEETSLDLEYLDPIQGGWLDQFEQLDFPNWKKHLMQMVIAEDPIAYLGEHLDG